MAVKNKKQPASGKTEAEIDKISGVETTGHEWDGLKELNNPLPRWWLWVFIVTCVWSVWYWVVYPAWPTAEGHTEGAYGWTQYKQLKASQEEIHSIQEAHLAMLRRTELAAVKDDPALYAFALAGGAAAFKNHCAACHGTGADGMAHYPNLNDDDWLWGGSVEDIYATIKYGIRSSHERTHLSAMTSFGKDGILTRTEVLAVTDYVRSLAGLEEISGEDLRGAEIFKEQCASCHGMDGKGDRNIGAPNLTDAVWLYGSSRDAVASVVFSARNGVMPHWDGVISEDKIRQLALYVHSLGGGE